MCGGTVKTIYTAMEKSCASFEQYNAPFLIIQGGCDKLVDPDVGFDLMERSPSKDKTRILFFHFSLLHTEVSSKFRK